MPEDRYTLDELVRDLDRITGEEPGPLAIAQRVAPLVGRLVRNPDCIPAAYRRRGPGGERGRWMLHRAPRFNVTAVVWRPGDTAGAHNHETWGVIGVVDNEIQETRFHVREMREGFARLEPREVLRHRPGAVSSLVPGDEIHEMHNPTDRDTVEIHVYGKDLLGLRRKTWAKDGTEKPLISDRYQNC